MPSTKPSCHQCFNPATRVLLEHPAGEKEPHADQPLRVELCDSCIGFLDGPPPAALKGDPLKESVDDHYAALVSLARLHPVDHRSLRRTNREMARAVSAYIFQDTLLERLHRTGEPLRDPQMRILMIQLCRRLAACDRLRTEHPELVHAAIEQYIWTHPVTDAVAPTKTSPRRRAAKVGGVAPCRRCAKPSIRLLVEAAFPGKAGPKSPLRVTLCQPCIRYLTESSPRVELESASREAKSRKAVDRFLDIRLNAPYCALRVGFLQFSRRDLVNGVVQYAIRNTYLEDLHSTRQPIGKPEMQVLMLNTVRNLEALLLAYLKGYGVLDPFLSYHAMSCVEAGWERE